MYLENCTVWCKLHKNRILSFEDIVILCFSSLVFVSKWRPPLDAILKQTLKTKIIKLMLFLKNSHYYIHLTNVTFVYYVNNHFMEVFYEYCILFRNHWETINIHCKLVTSQPHWFAGPQLDISKFSIFSNFLVYSPICVKFAPNDLVLDLLSFVNVLLFPSR